MEPWTYDRLEALIANGEEESLSLDYKAAGALQRTDEKRKEITKDISAMANSAGGVIIYGIREYQDKLKSHLPDCIDPVSRKDFPKEWLEHVIQNVKPRLESVIIHPVAIPDAPESVIYVVEIAQSSTAHQATDFRYYRRYNFESIAMHDYEIRDVMARRQHPLIEVEFHILLKTERQSLPGIPGITGETKSHDVGYLCAVANNQGRKTAQYVTAHLYLPHAIICEPYHPPDFIVKIEGATYHKYVRKNTVREIVGRVGGYPQYGEPRHEPILPQLTHSLASFTLDPEVFVSKLDTDCKIVWETFADDAPKRVGIVQLSKLKSVDNRKKED